MEDKSHSPQAQAIVFTSIGFAIVLLVFILFAVDKSAVPSYKPIKLASGEWAPYTSEELPEFGIVSAIVSHTFNQIGYQPDYQFMPWPSAESVSARAESDSGIRGVFPYSDPRDNPQANSDRNTLFYFSDSLLDIEIGIFYDARFNPAAAQITSPEDLAKFEHVLLEGYEYPPAFTPYLKKQPKFLMKSNFDAFEQFTHSQKPIVIIESADVGKRLIEQHFPALLPYIKMAPLSVSREVKLMLAKRNPNNLSLMRSFNKALKEFQQNKSAYGQFMQAVYAKLELANAVSLEPASGEEYVVGFANLDMHQGILLPKGSKAVVKQWSAPFLKVQDFPFADSENLVKVKLLNGPFASVEQELYVKAANIRLPVMPLPNQQ